MHFKETEGSTNPVPKGNIVSTRAVAKADIGDESVAEDARHSHAAELGTATTQPANTRQDARLDQLGDESSHFGEHTEDRQSGKCKRDRQVHVFDFRLRQEQAGKSAHEAAKLFKYGSKRAVFGNALTARQPNRGVHANPLPDGGAGSRQWH